MASQYKMENGYNVAEVDLDLIVPQPAGGLVRPVQRMYSVSGAVHEQGLFCELHWNTISAAQYQALLAQLGLTSSLTAEGTWYLPTHTFAYARFNGLAVRPEMGVEARRTNYFIRDVTIRVVKLVAL